MPGRLKFDYWSDPLCIRALVAQQKLDRVLASSASTFGSTTASFLSLGAFRGGLLRDRGQRTVLWDGSSRRTRLPIQRAGSDPS